jgi:hypothetical protein
MEKIMTYIYTKDELMTVVRWLEDHHNNSESQRLIIENGDDFAYLNGKGDQVHNLRAEETALRCVRSMAAGELGQVNAGRG